MTRTQRIVSAVVGLALVAAFVPASFGFAAAGGTRSVSCGQGAQNASSTASVSTTPTLRFTPRSMNATASRRADVGSRRD